MASHLSRINRRFFLSSLAATTAGLPSVVEADASVHVAVAESQQLPEFAAWHVGLITAHQPGLSIDENKSRFSELLCEFGCYHVRGRYIENYGTVNARPVEEHSCFVMGRKGDDSGNLKGCLRKAAREYEVGAFIYKSYYKDAELHILKGTAQRQGPSWEIRRLGPFHPSRIGDLHILLTRGGTIGWNLCEETIQAGPDGVDWFGGRWEDVGCWTKRSFFRRVERRVDFEKEHRG
jgi:hypothetical protein